MNIVASVHQRLLNYSRLKGLRFNEILQRYALERWLYRLSISPHADKFILKGALMLTVWELPISRPTKDIDMLAQTSNDLNVVKRIIKDICETEVNDDGLIFDVESISADHIAEDAVYEGVRSTFKGFLGKAQMAMQIDLGFSDVVTPAPVDLTFPTLLDQPAPRLKAYNHETAIAEKFQAMVKLGELNSRMKDFFDIWTLSQSRSFDGPVLVGAVRNTFDRRETVLSAQSVCFNDDFGTSENKQKQWAAFAGRSQISDQVPERFHDLWLEVTRFLKPLADSPELCGNWKPSGPWEFIPM